MFRYFFSKDSKKTPGLPIYKIKLKYDKNSNIEKRMNKSAIELYKDTELLVLGNNYLSQKDKNQKNKKMPPIIQNKQEVNLISNYTDRIKIKDKPQNNSNKHKKNHLILNQKFLINTNREFLAKKLIKLKPKEKNIKKIMKTSKMHLEQSKSNNINVKKEDNNYINKKLDESTERTNNSNILNKTSFKEKLLMHRIFFKKKTKNKIYGNIKKLTSILKDTSDNSIIIGKVLKNYSRDTSFRIYHQKIMEKSLKKSKSQDDIIGKPEMNMREIFDKSDNLLDQQLKQIKSKQSNINKFTWIKKTTANLIDFGQLSQSMNDEQFYKERKRIIGNYRNYEKEANIYIKNLKSEKPNYKSIVGYNNLKKIDELLLQNSQLIKNIFKKYNENKKG